MILPQASETETTESFRAGFSDLANGGLAVPVTTETPPGPLLACILNAPASY
jgi:hypothetical protein